MASKKDALPLAILAVLAIGGFLPLLTFAPSASAALDYTDCPSGVAAATSASAGNPGTGFVALSTGTGPGPVEYSVTIPANSDLIEYCVYPNGGSIGTVTQSTGLLCKILASGKPADSTLISACSTPVANWDAGFNCGSYSCVEARANQGLYHLLGPQGPTKVLSVNYTSALSSVLIVLHVSDEGSGVCGTSGTSQNPTTCFIIPTPPTTTTTTSGSTTSSTGGCPPGGCPPPVPEFPAGLLPLLLGLPILVLLRKKLFGTR